MIVIPNISIDDFNASSYRGAKIKKYSSISIHPCISWLVTVLAEWLCYGPGSAVRPGLPLLV